MKCARKIGNYQAFDVEFEWQQWQMANIACAHAQLPGSTIEICVLELPVLEPKALPTPFVSLTKTEF